MALFAADCLVPGSSGFGGLKRANDFLKIVQLALEQYKESGVLSPLFSVRYDMVFGAHTRTLIEPTLSILMGAIKDHFGIASKFINTFSANGEGASISESRTQCRILIAGREIINKTIECYCTDDLFMVFLQKHLIKNNYSFTKPSLNPFSESAFIKEFGKYVIERERCERVSRARIAEEERGRIKDVPMY